MTPDPPGKDRSGLQRLALEMAAGETPGDGLIRITVSGASMQPTLRPGDIILVRPGTAKGLKPGDLATYLTDTGPVTHRIVAVAGEQLIAKGDNARRLDSPFPTGRVVGTVVAALREGERRNFRPGFRAVNTARLSHLEGRITAKFGPARQGGIFFKLATLPLRLLIRISAFPGLSR